MSYSSGGDRTANTTSKTTRPRKGTVQKGRAKKETYRGAKEEPKKKAGGNNSQERPAKRGGLKRITPAQLNKLKEHSKQHGGMSSKHMKKMMMVMTKEGKSFSEAHRIAVRHDKMKK